MDGSLFSLLFFYKVFYTLFLSHKSTLYTIFNFRWDTFSRKLQLSESTVAFSLNWLKFIIINCVILRALSNRECNICHFKSVLFLATKDHLLAFLRRNIITTCVRGREVERTWKGIMNKCQTGRKKSSISQWATRWHVNHFIAKAVNNIMVDILRGELCAPKTTSL